MSALDPTSIKLVSHGWWSALMVFAAIGAVIFGLRDLLASRRGRTGRDAAGGSGDAARQPPDRAGHRRHRLRRTPPGAGA